MSINPQRHLDVFSPKAFGNRRVDVIGCGATGSRVARSLTQLGISNLHLWDFDTVEAHNIANQMYTTLDVGKLKVDALSAEIDAIVGERNFASIHPEKVDGTYSFGDIVFLLVDSMAVRKEIWEGALKMKLHTQFLIETRMGKDSGRVYAFNPNKRSYCLDWEKTLYDDSEAERSLCGGTISVGPTAEMLAGLAVWQLVRWFGIESGQNDSLEHEIIFGLKPTQFITRKFSEV